jgi:tetratricopeptide (TPR) repeat protein
VSIGDCINFIERGRRILGQLEQSIHSPEEVAEKSFAALACFQRAVKSCPDSSEANYELGMIRLRLGDLGGHSNLKLACQAGSLPLRCLLGALEYCDAQDRMNIAVSTIQERKPTQLADEIDDWLRVWQVVADTHRIAGHFPECANELERLLDSQPAKTQELNPIVIIEDAGGHRKSRGYTATVTAKLRLAECYLALERFDEAELVLHQLLTNSQIKLPSSFRQEVALMAVHCRQLQDDYAGALAYLADLRIEVDGIVFAKTYDTLIVLAGNTHGMMSISVKNHSPATFSRGVVEWGLENFQSARESLEEFCSSQEQLPVANWGFAIRRWESQKARQILATLP